MVSSGFSAEFIQIYIFLIPEITRKTIPLNLSPFFTNLIITFNTLAFSLISFSVGNYWVSRRLGFNPRLSHIKDFKIGTWCFVFISIIHICLFLFYLFVLSVFVNGPADQGLIPGWAIPKTQNLVLDASLLNTQYYKVRIKGKWSNQEKEVVPSPTPWSSSYWKGSVQVALNCNIARYTDIWNIHRMFLTYIHRT